MDYRQMAAQAARKHGIPPNLFMGLIRAESSWNPNNVSHAGAVGLTQVMPATARGMGYDPSQLARSPAIQLDAGARYLSQMYKQFGRWDHALAAYNAGPGRVRQHGGIPPIRETQNYVPRVLQFAQEYGAEGVPDGGGLSPHIGGPPPVAPITALEDFSQPGTTQLPGYPAPEPEPARAPSPTEGMSPMDLQDFRRVDRGERMLSPHVIDQETGVPVDITTAQRLRAVQGRWDPMAIREAYRTWLGTEELPLPDQDRTTRRPQDRPPSRTAGQRGPQHRPAPVRRTQRPQDRPVSPSRKLPPHVR